MKYLVLVRYGHHAGGYLTEEGKRSIFTAAEKLKTFVGNKKIIVIAPALPRAFESGQIIANSLDAKLLINDSLYAAEEDGKFPNNNKAKEFVESFKDDVELLIAIASREYIESLPSYLLSQNLDTKLDRGECLILDFNKGIVEYLR